MLRWDLIDSLEFFLVSLYYGLIKLIGVLISKRGRFPECFGVGAIILIPR